MNIAIQQVQTGVYFVMDVQGKRLHIDLLKNEAGEYYEAVANVFEAKKQVFNVFGPLQDVCAEVNNYFTKK